MFPKSNVELTKVHYLDDKNFNFPVKTIEIPTVSREVHQNNFNSNVTIKKNIFGHTWVLKVNENQEENEKNKFPIKLIVYIWVFSCILIAVSFGIYFSFVSRQNLTVKPSITHRNEVSNRTIQTNYTQSKPVLHQTTNETANLIKICKSCTDAEICLKTVEFRAPICARIVDGRDPSGCGGLCELKVQRCRKLHKMIDVFQCVENEGAFRCEQGEFNCGTSCVEKWKVCDGAVDCPDMADEKNCECNLDYYFHCGNRTSCIENAKRCNGIMDCWDGFDELHCERDCEPGKYPCVNGECIEKEEYCNGHYNCEDKSDEPTGCEK